MDDSNLSERELELIKLVATGASNKEISQHLHISVNTVKVHLRNIFTKLEVSSRTEAAMWAVQNGIVDTRGAEEIGVTPGGISNQEGIVQGVSDARWFSQIPPRTRFLFFSAGALVLVIIGFGISQITQSYRESDPTQEVISAATFEESRWNQLADMPTARAGFAAAAYDNQIYAVGGEGFEGVLDVNERYHPITDTWETLVPKPLAVADVHAGVIGGRIYIPGGRLENGDVTNALEVFDPRTGTWSEGAPLPIAMSAYALATFEGKLYVFGGWDGMNYLDNVFMYDPAQEIWIERSPMPTARAFAGAAEAGGKIYVIGGYDGEEGLAVNEVYEPALDGSSEEPWSKEIPMPEGRYGMGMASLADIVYVIGGISDQASNFRFEFYLLEPQWRAFEFSTQDLFLRVISLETNIHILGGLKVTGVSGNHKIFEAVFTTLFPIVR